MASSGTVREMGQVDSAASAGTGRAFTLLTPLPLIEHNSAGVWPVTRHGGSPGDEAAPRSGRSLDALDRDAGDKLRPRIGGGRREGEAKVQEVERVWRPAVEGMIGANLDSGPTGRGAVAAGTTLVICGDPAAGGPSHQRRRRSGVRRTERGASRGSPGRPKPDPRRPGSVGAASSVARSPR